MRKPQHQVRLQNVEACAVLVRCSREEVAVRTYQIQLEARPVFYQVRLVWPFRVRMQEELASTFVPSKLCRGPSHGVPTRIRAQGEDRLRSGDQVYREDLKLSRLCSQTIEIHVRARLPDCQD